MTSNNIYSQWIAPGKYGEKEMCKIGMLHRSVEEH